MLAIVQKVKKASVISEKNYKQEIKKGLLIYIGIGKNDNEIFCKTLAKKICNARIFPYEDKCFHQSIKDINGEVLIVSQFTLHANTTKGRRPSFSNAADPKIAFKLYNTFIEKIKNEVKIVKTGIFQSFMEINSVNEGPVTLIYKEGE